MEKNKIDILISESLKEETYDIKMSPRLRKNILDAAVDGKIGLYDRIHKIMNTTVEISLPSMLAACFIICMFTFSAFTATVNMKKDNSIMGYTSVKTISADGTNIILEYENEVEGYEKDKD